MAESSQNVESALLDAFKHPDPAPRLIELIRAHSQFPTIFYLISIYTELAAELPTQIDKFAQALAQVKTSKVKIDTEDDFGKPAQLDIEPIFVSELADELSGDFVNVKDLSVTSSNEYLIASLLSATSRKYRLCESPAQIGSVLCGLYYNDRKYGYADRATFEVRVLGACLQLLTSGSYLYGPEGIYAGKIDVLAALETIKKEGVVKNPNGQELLEATIQQAKLGFKLDVENAWNVLFPREE